MQKKYKAKIIWSPREKFTAWSWKGQYIMEYVVNSLFCIRNKKNEIKFNYLNGILCLFLILFPWKVQADCWLENKSTGKRFRIFNALLYKNLPDVSDLCIEQINVMYTWEFFPRGFKKGDLKYPKPEHLKQAIVKTKEKNKITVIDIEHWPIKNASNYVQSISTNNYLALINKFKQSLPDQTIGYYGVVPTIDFSRAKSLKKGAGYNRWVAENDRILPVASVVDAVFPSLYTINPNRKSWIDRAKAHIEEAHRIAPGKPVYPFVWPNYHPQGGQYPEGAELPPDYWKLQLTFLQGNVDGLVLWGGYKQSFKNDMLWWRELVKFIHASFEIKNFK